jgi:hypothetical protein
VTVIASGSLEELLQGISITTSDGVLSHEALKKAEEPEL